MSLREKEKNCGEELFVIKKLFFNNLNEIKKIKAFNDYGIEIAENK